MGPSARGQSPAPDVDVPELPDAKLTEAYRMAAERNVLAAVNDAVFPGYFSVCADGQGFGFGNSYPSLDGHQMADALLWLGRTDTVRKNWDYVRTFQKPDGQLPLAILPGLAGQTIGPPGAASAVDPNGGLYRHWVPGDPLRALAAPTFVQNADVLFRHTQDLAWLAAQLPAVNRTMDHLASLVSAEGAVGGAGYYVERPLRREYDGVAQCHAADAFRLAADLNRRAGDAAAGDRFQALADRVADHFRNEFWLPEEGRFAEYIHPDRGKISHHGLSDTDWSAIALDVATAAQVAALWPKLQAARDQFYYGGMPTGIAAAPERYEPWEFSVADSMDLAAMGRVWFLEARARARLGDGEGLAESLARVCRAGAENGYYWRERYYPSAEGGFRPGGVEKYNEYPANLIRIVCRFLLGIEIGLDGGLTLAPVVPAGWWDAGFGHRVRYGSRTLTYHHHGRRFEAETSGSEPLRLRVRLHPEARGAVEGWIAGQTIPVVVDGGLATLTVPASAESVTVSVMSG